GNKGPAAGSDDQYKRARSGSPATQPPCQSLYTFTLNGKLICLSHNNNHNTARGKTMEYAATGAQTRTASASAPPQRFAASHPKVGNDYKAFIFFYVTILGLVAPLSMIYVFVLGGDRVTTAYASFWAFDFAMYGMLLTPWLPLASLKRFNNYQRLSLMVQIWVITYVIVAATFEVPWLLLYKEIA